MYFNDEPPQFHHSPRAVFSAETHSLIVIIIHHHKAIDIIFPSSFMASFWSFLAMFMALMACNFSVALAFRQNMHVSTISAAPTTLPEAPVYFSPTMSPDIEPLFPTPGGAALSPSESSIPTIPSSPSPPNPDVTNSPGSVLAFPPSESMPALAPSSKGASLPLYSILHLAILLICIMQLHGM